MFLWFSVFLFAATYILKYTSVLKCYVMTQIWQKGGLSQLSDIKAIHCSIIPLLSPGSYPAVNADI